MSELKAIMSIKCSVTESGVGDVEYVSHNVPAHLKKHMETELLEGAKELATEKQLGESIKFFVEMAYTIEDLLEASPGPRVTEHQVEHYRDWETDRKSTRLNSSHSAKSRMPSSA